MRHPSANTAASGVLLATREPRPDGSGLYARASKPYQGAVPDDRDPRKRLESSPYGSIGIVSLERLTAVRIVTHDSAGRVADKVS